MPVLGLPSGRNCGRNEVFHLWDDVCVLGSPAFHCSHSTHCPPGTRGGAALGFYYLGVLFGLKKKKQVLNFPNFLKIPAFLLTHPTFDSEKGLFIRFMESL